MVAVVVTTVPLTFAALIGTALIVTASSWSTSPSSRRAAALVNRANSLNQAANSSADVAVQDVEGSRTPFNETVARFSFGGNGIAAVSADNGTNTAVLESDVDVFVL
ncbi:hypothetical protein MTO96_028328 [Rhipicephalus appendiculatus]